jgi:glycerol kinase
MELTLAIDQGTHASRALLFDRYGKPVASRLLPVALTRGPEGRVEQDAGRVLASVGSVVDAVLATLPAQQRHAVRACGLSTQRSTVLAWHAGGKPVSPALSWQDTRGAAQVEALRPRAARIREYSGLPLSAHYGASKLHWLRRTIADGRNLRIGPLAAFLLDNLTDTAVTRIDHANAQRMQLLDVRRRCWSPTLLEWFDVPVGLLPRCTDVIHDYGLLRGHGIPVAAVCGDQNAAWFAEGRPDSDCALVNIGSGAFALAAADATMSDPALLDSIAASDSHGCDHLLEATVNGAGSALQWLQQRYGGDEPQGSLATWMQQVTSPPLFINTVGGLGSPWWRPGLAPGFHPQHASCTPAERAAAVAESIVFLLQCNLERMQRLRPLRRLRASGGLAAVAPLCQKLADLSGLPVSRTQHREASARGIAWLAAGRPADWSTGKTVQHFTPRPDSALKDRYGAFLAQLQKYIEAGTYE